VLALWDSSEREVNMPWREQYERMLRWRARLEEPMRQDETREDYNTRIADYLHSFFLTCYHLNDWLEKDPTTASAHGQAKKHADTAPWLSKCCRIALGSKHAVLYSGSRPRIDAGTTTRSETLYGVPSRQGIRTFPDSYFDIEIDGQVHEAIPVADECIREWNGFLRMNGLLQ
jgi:hypothetical protein